MKRLKLAAVVTEYRKYSHAQHIVDRFLYGYGWNGKHHYPEMDVVSLYTDQVPKSDASRSRAEEFDSLTIYPSVAEALTQGGEKLAVDGVLLIGEHGDYPYNEKGQHLYPRYELFKQIVKVFQDSSRSVPVFNDKHLSWNWDWAKEMVQDSVDLDFGLMAGSSLPFARRIPDIEFEIGTEIEEVMCVSPGGIDSYDLHALEVLQCMTERRKGGETGVSTMHAIKGQPVWDSLQTGKWEDGGFDPKLFEACLCRSHKLNPSRSGYSHHFPTMGELRQRHRDAIAYRFEYTDGVKASIILADGLVGDFNFAARIKGQKDVASTLMFLPYYDLQNFFSPQVNAIETLMRTGKSPARIERTLMTTGLTAAGVESLFQKQKRINTPHLGISYHPFEQSAYWRT